MKKILLIAASALVAVSAFAQPKFAHVNTTELIQLCPEMDKARETLNAAQMEAQETFNDMQTEFNTKLQTYQSKGSTWTDATRQQRLQEFSQTVQMELQQQEQTLMQPIYEKVNNVIQDLAKKGGYIFVFNAEGVLYVDPAQSHDLTPEARKALDIPADRTLETLAAELQAKQQAAAAAQQ